MPEQFSAHGPIEAHVRIGSGEVLVETAPDGSATAEVRPLDPTHEPSVRLAASADIRFDGRRLAVTTPEHGRVFRRAEVVVTLGLPPSSALTLKAGTVTLRCQGGLEGLDAKVGTGELHLDTVERLVVKGGQVEVDVDSAGSVAVATGQGGLRARQVRDASVKTGHGQVELGRTDGAVAVKGGAVHLSIRAAAGGEVSYDSAAGSARVGVPAGTTVQLDLSSAVGDVRCDLPVESAAPPDGAALRLRLRTAAGDVLVSPVAPAEVA